METISHSSSIKETIIHATLSVMLRDGLRNLSMDAVARESNLSKGGLFHHFHSKDELLAGLMHFVAEHMRQALTERAERDPHPGGWLRALVTLAFSDVEPRPADLTPAEALLLSTLKERLLASLLAIAAHDRTLLNPMKAVFFGVAQRLRAEPEGDDQIALWLAVEGLMFFRIMQLMQPSDPFFIEAANLIRSRAAKIGRSAEEAGGA